MDILENFKNRRWRSNSTIYTSIPEIYFMIDFDIDGHAILKTCDKKGHTTDVDYRNYSGNTFQLLRSMEAVRDTDAATITWLPVSI